MKRVMLIVAYDGTEYCGWQIQPNGETIEGVLNRELTHLLGEKIVVTAEPMREFIPAAMWRFLIQRHGCQRRKYPML